MKLSNTIVKDSFVAVSDFHGYGWTLEKVKLYVNEYNYVFIIGDAMDRGPSKNGAGSIQMLRKIKKMSDELEGQVVYIPGNHDSFFYDAFQNNNGWSMHQLNGNGGSKTIEEFKDLQRESPDEARELLEWLGKLPLQRKHQFDNQQYALAHAFFNENYYKRNPNYNLEDLYREGYFSEDSESHQILWYRFKKPYDEKNVPSSDTKIIIGHTPIMRRDSMLSLKNARGENVEVICVDNGIAYGNSNEMLKYDGSDRECIRTEVGSHKDTSPKPSEVLYVGTSSDSGDTKVYSPSKEPCVETPGKKKERTIVNSSLTTHKIIYGDPSRKISLRYRTDKPFDSGKGSTVTTYALAEDGEYNSCLRQASNFDVESNHVSPFIYYHPFNGESLEQVDLLLREYNTLDRTKFEDNLSFHSNLLMVDDLILSYLEDNNKYAEFVKDLLDPTRIDRHSQFKEDSKPYINRVFSERCKEKLGILQYALTDNDQNLLQYQITQMTDALPLYLGGITIKGGEFCKDYHKINSDPTTPDHNVIDEKRLEAYYTDVVYPLTVSELEKYNVHIPDYGNRKFRTLETIALATLDSLNGSYDLKYSSDVDRQRQLILSGKA